LINKNRLLKKFIKYVKMDSLSKKERKFAAYLRRELKSLGISTVEDKAGSHIGGDCGNFFGTLKGNFKGAPRILLNAHIDTVMPGTNIKPKVSNGVVTSDGTTVLGADNKAGVAVIMEVIQTIKEKKLPHGDIDILFTVAEEIGLCGAKFTDRKFLKADFGYVLDGGDVDEIINKAPSQDSVEVKITGRAAHAGVHPEDGINAIKVAGIALSKMKLGRLDKETTSNIGLISGGLATNIVPETVEMKGEARSHDRDKLRKQILHMSNVLYSTCHRMHAKLLFNVRPAYRSFEIEKGSALLELAVTSARQIGIKPKVKATGGGSDANIFNALGMPCVILGVGADKVHTKSENVKVKDMAKGAELVLKILEESLKCSKKR
jgi:tripeptide aminopeptidase